MLIARLSPRTRKRLGFVLVALFLAGTALYWTVRTSVSPFFHLEALWRDAPLARMRPQEFEAQVAHDLRELGGLRDGMARLSAEVGRLAATLPRDAGALTPEERRRLRELWLAFLDHQIGLDSLKPFYQAFPGVSRWSGAKDNWRHARAFAIAYLIHLMQIDESRAFVDAFLGRKDYENFLDEEVAAAGVPAGSYARLKLRAIHVQTFAEVHLLQKYHEGLRRSHYGPYLAAEPAAPDAWVPAAIDERAPRVKAWYAERGLASFATNTRDVVTEDLFEHWFPVQKEVSEWMGDTKVTRRAALITEEQTRGMQAVLEPGDILIERRNWYLSNVGLPGFWPHAALYLGSYTELAAYFDADPETRAWCAAAGSDGALELLARRGPDAAEAFRQEAFGHPARVIEAVSEGVLFSSLEHSCAADYVAALRPRLPRLDKFKAVAAAFGHWGKPYDFNFDFLTDDGIVCSELVYKAYRPDTDKRGLTLELSESLGRKVFPANEFVGVFRRELDAGNRQLDFVYFLQGIERERRAVVSSARALWESYTRPKWCILQK
ncbi:MAG: hypothetical protein HZA54_18230 [Planctomycetes bacterium]|nr:hypothetical protein [Planctomycetota bacterium]